MPAKTDTAKQWILAVWVSERMLEILSYVNLIPVVKYNVVHSDSSLLAVNTECNMTRHKRICGNNIPWCGCISPKKEKTELFSNVK
ncbi:hypothetical protein [Kosakonia oryziphila]|uniref:hypothetical protein n=1 Tax=Kosakonia oryziphila TaxID=1005667 RepID=UPI0014289DAD|nr:hypothetical protein [Kosakonia oryziphila]